MSGDCGTTKSFTFDDVLKMMEQHEHRLGDIQQKLDRTVSDIHGPQVQASDDGGEKKEPLAESFSSRVQKRNGKINMEEWMKVVVLVECPYCKRSWPVTVKNTNKEIHFYEKIADGSIEDGIVGPIFKTTKGSIYSSNAIFTCSNGGCLLDSVVNVELEAHVTTRKIEQTEEGGK